MLNDVTSAVLVEHCLRSNGGLYYADRDEFVVYYQPLVDVRSSGAVDLDAIALAGQAGVTTAPAAPAARTLLAVGDDSGKLQFWPNPVSSASPSGINSAAPAPWSRRPEWPCTRSRPARRSQASRGC